MEKGTAHQQEWKQLTLSPGLAEEGGVTEVEASPDCKARHQNKTGTNGNKKEKGPSRKWMKVRCRQFAKEHQVHTNTCKYTQYQDVTPSEQPSRMARIKAGSGAGG